MTNLPISYHIDTNDGPYGHYKGRIWGVDAPKSAVAKMREWLDDNNRLPHQNGAEAIVTAIARCYPGGMEAWANENGYTTNIHEVEHDETER